jgi:hypothetical protein
MLLGAVGGALLAPAGAPRRHPSGRVWQRGEGAVRGGVQTPGEATPRKPATRRRTAQSAASPHCLMNSLRAAASTDDRLNHGQAHAAFVVIRSLERDVKRALQS